MSHALTQGLPAAFLAAGLYGCAPVVQAVAAKELAPAGGVGIGLLRRLATRRLWLTGLACEFGGFVAEAFAFSRAPATMVAPLMACDVMVFVLLSVVVLGEGLSATGSAGIAAVVLGVGLLAFSFSSPQALGSPADFDELLTVLLVGLVGVGVALLLSRGLLRRGRRPLAAAGYGFTAGLAYGLATMMTRQFGLSFQAAHPLRLLTTLTPYALAIFSLLAISVMQLGLQLNPVLAFPVTSVTSAFLPVILGSTLLSDSVPDSGAEICFVAALLAVAVGVALLGRDRGRAERTVSPPGQPAPRSVAGASR